MRHVRNIHITDKQDANIQQGESLLKYWVIAFLAVAWFTRSDHEAAQPVVLYHAASYHTAPGADSSTLNLILDWF